MDGMPIEIINTWGAFQTWFSSELAFAVHIVISVAVLAAFLKVGVWTIGTFKELYNGVRKGTRRRR